MDFISHVLWALTIFQGVVDYKLILNIILIIIVSILPDLFWLHFFCYKYKRTKSFKSLFKNKKEEIIEYIKYGQPKFFKLRHSLLTWIIFSFILVLFFWKFLFLSLFYLLHILLNMPTHSRERGPEILWPFSNYKFQGLEFEEHPWIIILSYVLLIFVNLIIFLIKFV